MASFEDFLTATHDWGQGIVARDVPSSGTAIRGDNRSRQELPYWSLRNHLYGSYDPLYAMCPIMEDPSERENLVDRLAEVQVIPREQAKKWLSYQPEQKELVISGTGKLALLTFHTHLRHEPYKELSKGIIRIEDFVDPIAIANGYTAEMAMNDFIEDVSKHKIYGIRPKQPRRLTLPWGVRR